MILRSLLAFAGILSISLFSPEARALDSLPLPHMGPASIQVEVTEFANTDAAPKPVSRCGQYLQETSSDQKIRAIKAYRECRSREALQQLAVWRWQEASYY